VKVQIKVTGKEKKKKIGTLTDSLSTRVGEMMGWERPIRNATVRNRYARVM